MYFRFFFVQLVKEYGLKAAAIILVVAAIASAGSAVSRGDALHVGLWTAGAGAVIALVAAVWKACHPGSFV